MKYYLSLVLRRLHWVILLFVLFTAGGLTLAKILPPVYVSHATLIVESEQIPGDLAETTVRTGAIEQLQIIQQRIMTRDRLLDLANKLGIYALPGQNPMDANEKVADLRRRIRITTTGGDTSRRGPQQATIVTVTFEAPNPQLAATVVNEVVTMLLDENVQIRTAVAGQTLDFFQTEVNRLEKALSKKGAEMLDFQEKNLDSLPDSLDFRRSQQSAAQERLQTTERSLADLRDRRARLVDLYESTGVVADPATPVSDQTPEERQLQALQDELNKALAVLSPENPRVKVMQAQLAVLEKKVAAQKEAAGETGPQGRQLSPYEIQLADIDGQIDSLNLQKSQIEALLAELQKTIEATPSNAITQATLQRDYDNLRSQYDQAVSAKAQAETGQMLESLAKAQRISVVEQAVAPTEPSSPNRLMIAAGGVFGGLAAGAALILLLELLNTSVRRPEDLVRKLGITAFGTVPLIRTRAERLRRRVVIVFGTIAIAAGLSGGLWYVDTYVTPLDLLINQVLDKVGLAALDTRTGNFG